MTVSYVVPVYNGERYVSEAINSILGQTVPPFEILVVDDGSTDGTAQAVAHFGDRVSYLLQPQAGQSAARNRGAELAKGEFIAFLDADDLIHPKKLETQLRQFALQPQLQLCDAYHLNFWSPEIPEKERFAEPLQRLTHSESPRAHSIVTWLIRRELFHQIGPFNESKTMGEDTEWYDHVIRSGAATKTLDEILVRRRLHGANLTLRRYDAFLKEVVRNQKRLVTRAKSNAYESN